MFKVKEAFWKLPKMTKKLASVHDRILAEDTVLSPKSYLAIYLTRLSHLSHLSHF